VLTHGLGARTVSPEARPAQPIGFPALEVLEQHSVLMPSGLTGSSVYWPEVFSYIHPALATTDVSFNRVDEVWARPRGETMFIVMYEPTPTVRTPAVAESVAAVRDTSGLSANDVARLVGLRRRQLYNLLGGGQTTAERERWIHVVAAFLDDLFAAASQQPKRVRSALLQPDESGVTLFDLVTEGDEARVRARVDELCDELQRGRHGGRVQRPSPRLKRLGRSSSANDFLSEYRE
jgi:hypothetical protein